MLNLGKIYANLKSWSPVLVFLALCSCSPVGVLNSLIKIDGYRVEKDIAFGPDRRQKLDIYIPDKIKKPAKTIVFIYGGSWQFGSKNDYLFAAQAFVSQGFIVIVPDYRLAPQFKYPVFLEDNAKAFRWAVDNINSYGGDKNHLYLAGHSAGAYEAVSLAVNHKYLEKEGVKPSSVKAVVGMSGPYNFLPIIDPKIIAVFEPEPDLRKTQPINYVKKGLPPFLLLTGEKDDLVGPHNTYDMANKLKKYGNEVTLKTYPNLGHIGTVSALAPFFRGRGSVLKDITDFIDSH